MLGGSVRSSGLLGNLGGLNSNSHGSGLLGGSQFGCVVLGVHGNEGYEGRWYTGWASGRICASLPG